MTENAPTTSVRERLVRVLLPPALILPAAFATAHAQTSEPVALSLGDAARLAAKQNATVVAARYRAEQAGARITQRRADIMPNFSASALENGRTLNTATFGIDFPTATGQPPVFNPDG